MVDFREDLDDSKFYLGINPQVFPETLPNFLTDPIFTEYLGRLQLAQPIFLWARLRLRRCLRAVATSTGGQLLKASHNKKRLPTCELKKKMSGNVWQMLEMLHERNFDAAKTGCGLLTPQNVFLLR